MTPTNDREPQAYGGPFNTQRDKQWSEAMAEANEPDLCDEIMRFVRDFYPETNHDRRMEHLLAEVEELRAAKDKTNRVEECADIALILFHMMLADERNPLATMRQKLAVARLRIESGVKKPRPFTATNDREPERKPGKSKLVYDKATRTIVTVANREPRGEECVAANVAALEAELAAERAAKEAAMADAQLLQVQARRSLEVADEMEAERDAAIRERDEARKAKDLLLHDLEFTIYGMQVEHAKALAAVEAERDEAIQSRNIAAETAALCARQAEQAEADAAAKHDLLLDLFEYATGEPFEDMTEERANAESELFAKLYCRMRAALAKDGQ